MAMSAEGINNPGMIIGIVQYV